MMSARAVRHQKTEFAKIKYRCTLKIFIEFNKVMAETRIKIAKRDSIRVFCE